MKSSNSIDVNFDFTTDTPCYWDGFWENNNGLGGSKKDPDSLSRTLQKYHQILWSKKLPNGEFMKLNMGSGGQYLTWKNFRFGSDSIAVSFRYRRYRHILNKVEGIIPNYKEYMESFIRKTYTIGGMIIFPKWHGGINQSRGCNSSISDRWDLTLECIRKYYNDEPSPLYETLAKDKEFYNLFVDFKGYVDYFYLQDCVSSDYKSVNFWIGKGDFNDEPLPETPEAYIEFIEKELEFVEKRNTRIQWSFY